MENVKFTLSIPLNSNDTTDLCQFKVLFSFNMQHLVHQSTIQPCKSQEENFLNLYFRFVCINALEQVITKPSTSMSHPSQRFISEYRWQTGKKHRTKRPMRASRQNGHLRHKIHHLLPAHHLLELTRSVLLSLPTLQFITNC